MSFLLSEANELSVAPPLVDAYVTVYYELSNVILLVLISTGPLEVLVVLTSLGADCIYLVVVVRAAALLLSTPCEIMAF